MGTEKYGKVRLGMGERGIVGEVFPADGKAGLRMNQEEECTARDGEDAEKWGVNALIGSCGGTQLVGGGF